MTFIGKMILFGLSSITSTTGVTLLVVNKDKLFETNSSKDNSQPKILGIEKPVDTKINNALNIPAPNNSENKSSKEKDYICRFDGTYDQENNKKKIKEFLGNSKWNTKIVGIQILEEGENNFKCAKDMNDADLAGVFEYLSTNKEIESGLSSVGGRQETDNVIALKKAGNEWTGFGQDNENNNENNNEEILSPIKKIENS